jgi:hypothetical protein
MPAAITDRWTSSGSLHDVTTDGNNPIVCHVLHGTKEKYTFEAVTYIFANYIKKALLKLISIGDDYSIVFGKMPVIASMLL